MTDPKYRWEGLARRRDAKAAANGPSGSVDIAGWEGRVEVAIERGDPFLLLRQLASDAVGYPGLGRRLAEAMLGPFVALQEPAELRSSKCLRKAEHRGLWEAVEALGLVPLVRRARGVADGGEPEYRLVVDLRAYATRADREQAREEAERPDDETEFH